MTCLSSKTDLYEGFHNVDKYWRTTANCNIVLNADARNRQNPVLYLVYFTDFISCLINHSQSKVTETNLIVFIFPFLLLC